MKGGFLQNSGAVSIGQVLSGQVLSEQILSNQALLDNAVKLLYLVTWVQSDPTYQCNIASL